MTTQHRADLDAEVTFSNGGRITVEGFRVDVPGPEVTPDEAAGLLVASLGLLMTESVQVSRLDVVEEAHKGTRGGPSDAPQVAVSAGSSGPGGRRRRVELNHVIRSGEVTYPGLPAPVITPHLTREASRATYAPGTEFAIDSITMVGNTGTYMDSPIHRYADGGDLTSYTLDQLVDLPLVVVRTVGSGGRAVDVGQLAPFEVAGCAVLLHTGGDTHWGRPEYAVDAPYLTAAGADWLVQHGAALVGIDAVNIDAVDDPDHARPAHSALLAAGIPLVEHLTGLDQLPPLGATFTAVPPRVEGFGTFTVRAYATL